MPTVFFVQLKTCPDKARNAQNIERKNQHPVFGSHTPQLRLNVFFSGDYLNGSGCSRPTFPQRSSLLLILRPPPGLQFNIADLVLDPNGWLLANKGFVGNKIERLQV